MSITTTREDKAYEKIDKIIRSNKELDTNWFLTHEDLENVIKKDINKYYEFCLYILEVCVPVTINEKAIHKELSDFIKSIEVV